MAMKSISERSLQDHMLDVKRGNHPAALVLVDRKLSADVTFAVPAGRVLHLDRTDGQLHTGVDDTAAATSNIMNKLPLWLEHNSDERYVQTPGEPDPTSAYDVYRGANAKGQLFCRMGNGDYIVLTSEYTTGLTYSPGDLLTATKNDTTYATGGVLTNASVTFGGTKTIVGYVGPNGLAAQVGRGGRPQLEVICAFWPRGYNV